MDLLWTDRDMIQQAGALYEEGLSLLEVSAEIGANYSATRNMVMRSGVEIRSRKKAGGMAGPKISRKAKGVNRGPFTDLHKKRISEGRSRWGKENAVGVRKTSNGYMEHTTWPKKGHGVHRSVAEEKIGRTLRADEVVHHVNGARDDNRPDKLEVMTRSEHCKLHATENHTKRSRNDLGQFTGGSHGQ